MTDVEIMNLLTEFTKLSKLIADGEITDEFDDSILEFHFRFFGKMGG